MVLAEVAMISASCFSRSLFDSAAQIIKELRNADPFTLSDENRTALLPVSGILHLAIMGHNIFSGASPHMWSDGLKDAGEMCHALCAGENWSDESLDAKRYWRHAEATLHTVNGLLLAQTQMDLSMGIAEGFCREVGSHLSR